jgi:DivIVA domain-containing protein
MSLTPEDVSNKRFTPVRLREGYDMGEVDAFLDEVEAELVRLLSENDDFRGRLTAAGHGDDLPVAATADDKATADKSTPDKATGTPAATTDGTVDETSDSSQPVVTATSTTPAETLKVTTASEASTAAVRLLEIATRNADELVGEARSEAERLVEEARVASERRDAESRATAERVESEATQRAESLDAETEERRRQLLGALDTEKQGLSAEIENLRSFEREYRSRLKAYFEQQLDALNGAGDVPDREQTDESGQSSPGRLQSLLGGSSSSSSKDGDQA